MRQRPLQGALSVASAGLCKRGHMQARAYGLLPSDGVVFSCHMQALAVTTPVVIPAWAMIEGLPSRSFDPPPAAIAPFPQLQLVCWHVMGMI